MSDQREALPAPRRGQWFSSNPGKAWAERFFLLYSPFWMAAVALVQLTGWMKSWGDLGFLLFGLGIMAPLVVVPLLRPAEADRGRPWYLRYWFRFNCWVWIFVWIASYFYTHYFFDYLGMRYRFPVQWTLDAAIAGQHGSGAGAVPFFLYLVTQAYFVTYFTAMVVLLRWLRTRFDLGILARALAVVGLAYVVAFAETFFMANDLLKDYFSYASRSRMLAYGSLFYACYFIVSAPLVARLDEEERGGEAPQPALPRVCLESLGAGMLALIILDAWALLLGPLTP